MLVYKREPICSRRIIGKISPIPVIPRATRTTVLDLFDDGATANIPDSHPLVNHVFQ